MAGGEKLVRRNLRPRQLQQAQLERVILAGQSLTPRVGRVGALAQCLHTAPQHVVLMPQTFVLQRDPRRMLGRVLHRLLRLGRNLGGGFAP